MIGYLKSPPKLSKQSLIIGELGKATEHKINTKVDYTSINQKQTIRITMKDTIYNDNLKYKVQCLGINLTIYR